MNEPVRVVIVDDEPLARQAIRMLLADDPEIEVVGECSGVGGAEVIQEARPEVLFLDVQMPEVDGFDLLDEIGVDEAPVVVFITAHSEHALRAFEVHAVDYLLKPLVDERFARALARAKQQAWSRRLGVAGPSGLGALLREHSRRTRRILVRHRGRTQVIEAGAIDWIEAADYYALIHVGVESHLIRETMNQLEERLDPERFVRAHRSAIVNVDRVREILPGVRGDRMLVLEGGARVRLSRARREAFERRMGTSSQRPD